MNTLVCILSDQTIPNILFIKQFQEQDDKYVFFTSEEMEKKNIIVNILRTLQLQNKNVNVIKLDANSVKNNQEILESLTLTESDQYIVNVTGGNKLMSLLIFQFFSKFDNSEIYYYPIDLGFCQQIFPVTKEIVKYKKVEISLNEYLSAYGFEIYSKGRKTSFGMTPEKLFENCIKYGPSKVETIKKALDQGYNKSDKVYLTGAWFEEWFYNFLKTELKIIDSNISFNVKVKKNDSTTFNPNDSEFDVIFMYNNQLFAIECKVYTKELFASSVVSEPMFKLNSLTQQLGLKIKTFVAILGNFTRNINARNRIEDLKKQLKISNVFFTEDFKNLPLLIEKIKK